MASTPTYASTPRLGTCQLANADGTTAKDFTNLTPAAAGTRVKEIRVHSGPTTAPGGTTKVLLLVHDGTNARIIDVFSMTNTTDTQQAIFRYENLILPTGHKLQAVTRTALTSGATLDFVAEGEDLT